MGYPEIIRPRSTDTACLVPVLFNPVDASIAASRWEGLLPWQAKRVRDYVDDHLHDGLSMKTAAQHAKLSPGYFSRRFRQCFGVSFSRFVAHRRIERAQAMMLMSASGLCQIALDCGFADQAHFTRTFGAVTGWPPSQWRRRAADTAVVRDTDGMRRAGAIASC